MGLATLVRGKGRAEQHVDMAGGPTQLTTEEVAKLSQGPNQMERREQAARPQPGQVEARGAGRGLPRDRLLWEGLHLGDGVVGAPRLSLVQLVGRPRRSGRKEPSRQVCALLVEGGAALHYEGRPAKLTGRAELAARVASLVGPAARTCT